MPTIDVVNLKKEKVGQVELSDAVFGVEVNEALMWESVRHYTASRRGGNAKTKVRREVAGSGKKLWRQKGTGRARMGSVRSPLWRHGGTVHGPVPRDYSYRLPKKMLVGALRSALTAKLRDGELMVVEAFPLDDHKTKTVMSAFRILEATGKVLVVDNSDSRDLQLGARNLPGVKVVASREVTTYDLLGHDRILMSKGAAKKLSEALA